jgi:hypothetical protein
VAEFGVVAGDFLAKECRTASDKGAKVIDIRPLPLP